jgi:hypothetical protein
MGAIQTVDQGDNSLDALLADLNLLPEEVVIEAEPKQEAETALAVDVVALSPDVSEDDETIEDIMGDLSVDPAEKPAKPAKKAKAEKKAKEPKAPKEPKVAVPRKHYTNKVERISDKLGSQLGDFTVLELADAVLEGDALAAKQKETLEIIKTSGKKVQNRQTFILEFIAGKSAKLNGVIETAIAILNKDGFIATGVEGNFHQALLAKPYSVNAAKAMGNNSLLALKSLKVIVAGEKGTYIPNKNSLILMKLNAMNVGVV